MGLRVTLMGTGGSYGVPTVGNVWGNCDPSNPLNRRRRPSVLVEWDDTNLLIDASPDLREQLLEAKVERIDAVVFTHSHADHVNGIDDLRVMMFRNDGPLPAYMSRETHHDLKTRFGYALSSVVGDGNALYRPLLRPIETKGPIVIGERKIEVIEQDHHVCMSWGLRFGDLAYCTDVVRFSDESFGAIAGLDTLVIDATRIEPHPTHAHLERTLEWIGQLKPRRAILTHMNQSLDYQTMVDTLPPGVEPGYDGMVITLPWE